MFGRRVVVSLRFPLQQRRLLTPYPPQTNAASRAVLCQPRRTYATPGRPRNVVGEPSKPVKRAVKRAAAKATTSEDSPAKRKIEEKKEAAAKKPATAKKPAKPRKAAAPGAPAKKRAPRKKALTEEEQLAKETKLQLAKAAKAVRLGRQEMSSLKKAALKPPAIAISNAFLVFATERAKKSDSLRTKGDGQRQRLSEQSRATGKAWQQCSPAEVEHYNHLARTARETSQAEYKRWVLSHPPEQIEAANRARQQLRRKLPQKGKRGWPPIQDERAARTPLSAFLQFSTNRHASGDFNNIAVPECAKLIGQEWKALSGEEKQKYKALEKEDVARYTDEYTSVYGHGPRSLRGTQAQPSQPQAAAAAA
ncbi:hypothetical protein B0A55_02047 [Friedmanniomyces simplex]|uniref:HMG box domain-containing protein n=1 Tax=Friedmanniomyces simplex TaxID=329884 RepID=A0A4U0XYW5_9PEZI|nr:hypothetical protein B0A55_02047 [Friedmanniomyces simplex]